jgi:hypothetical protein
VFVLTLVVVDDIASLVVIAVAHTRDLSLSGRSQRRSASRATVQHRRRRQRARQSRS